MVIVDKYVQLLNAYWPIDVTESGMVIKVVAVGTCHRIVLDILYVVGNDVDENAYWSIDVTESEMVIDVKFKHS